MQGAPTIFLDRDGVLVEELGYLTSVEQMRLIPGAGQGIRALNAQGWRVVVVTNQSAVARGFLSEVQLKFIHQQLLAQLKAEGALLDGIFCCPHHPDGGVDRFRKVCDCRKPATGLIRQAAEKLGLAMDERSVMVGDQLSDLECARAAGLRPVLVRTGKGAALEKHIHMKWPEVAICNSIIDVPGFVGVAPKNRLIPSSRLSQ